MKQVGDRTELVLVNMLVLKYRLEVGERNCFRCYWKFTVDKKSEFKRKLPYLRAIKSSSSLFYPTCDGVGLTEIRGNTRKACQYGKCISYRWRNKDATALSFDPRVECRGYLCNWKERVLRSGSRNQTILIALEFLIWRKQLFREFQFIRLGLEFIQNTTQLRNYYCSGLRWRELNFGSTIQPHK